ncbi:hypothetical protein SPTER_31960 [Sporomusa termitida]|uniref:Uncharacterized protein n=1 Tax=Sporomusa termitida TaxID=2377 RepID=A0A517DWQ4_9FIRM|nr:hypothetical protein SPTER_31960 [Sporomusa termitida]
MTVPMTVFFKEILVGARYLAPRTMKKKYWKYWMILENQVNKPQDASACQASPAKTPALRNIS